MPAESRGSRHLCDDRLRAESLRRCTRCHVAFAPLSPIWNRRTFVPTATTRVKTMSATRRGDDSSRPLARCANGHAPRDRRSSSIVASATRKSSRMSGRIVERDVHVARERGRSRDAAPQRVTALDCELGADPRDDRDGEDEPPVAVANACGERHRDRTDSRQRNQHDRHVYEQRMGRQAEDLRDVHLPATVREVRDKRFTQSRRIR